MRRSRIALCSLAAIVFCGILYRHGLSSWFQQDDFPRLGLGMNIHSAGDLFHAVFDPMAQGTFRPISEKAFYLTLSSLFGLNAAPYRAIVFLTQFGNLILLSAIAFTLTESYVAAFWAPVLWVANSALALPMTWSAAYNQILCSFCFLLSFYFLLRYTRTGEPRFNRYQWLVFLLGFGVLETNTVYPLIAILYTMLFARRYFKTTCWLIAPSLVFALLDRLARLKPSARVYALHFDFSVPLTLWSYWKTALGPGVAAELFPRAHIPATILIVVLSAALLGFAAYRTWRGDRNPALFLGWFLIALLPYLPLRDHISDYYLTVPLIGLALLGAYAASRRPAAAYICIAIYLACAAPAANRDANIIASRSLAVKRLVTGVRAQHRRFPADAILLDGVDSDLFWSGVYDHPFPLAGVREVYLTPDSVNRITPDPETGNVADYIMPQPAMSQALRENRATVLSVNAGRVKDITSIFQQAAPTHLDLVHPPVPSLVGASWYPPEQSYRWMPKRATVVLGSPGAGPVRLRVNAICVPVQLQSGPLELQVQIGDRKPAPVRITSCQGAQILTFPVTLPAEQTQFEVALEVNRTIRVGYDLRDLGLAVLWIELTKSE